MKSKKRIAKSILLITPINEEKVECVFMKINELKEQLYDCYTKDLCYPKMKQSWSEKNKCIGMSDITSLILNDYFGGNIYKIKVFGRVHYFNIINDIIFDFTSSQFNKDIEYKNFELVRKETLLSDKNTNKRYLNLKSSLEEKI